MKSMLGVALLCLASSAMASNWVNLPSSSGGGFTSTSYNKQSLKRHGTRVDVWISRTWPNTVQLENVFFDTVLDHWQFDCHLIAGWRRLSVPSAIEGTI
jgi:hypothetical protein